MRYSGKNSPRFKGYKIVTSSRGYQYKVVFAPQHPYANGDKYVPEHRLIMEKTIGRYLEPGEVVHHINENTLDNRIDNLQLFACKGDHQRHHINKKIGGGSSAN
jgi:hypothetical protein